MKISATVILYHPASEVLKNIETYKGFVDCLYVFDNTEGEANSIAARVKEIPGIQYVHDGVNRGIGYRLNQAIEMARKADAAFLLTMDQDSFFEPGVFLEYLSCVTAYDVRQVAMFGVRYDTGSTGAKCDAVTVTALITSGSILNLSLVESIGIFEERLFIDEVDHEYCYRARKKGYQVVQFRNLYLSHQLGVRKVAGYLGFFLKRERTVHRPQRLYFMIRNYLYVRRLYVQQEPAAFALRDKQMRTTIKNNLLFSGKFFAVCYYLYRGYLDYRRNRFEMNLIQMSS